MQRNNDDKYINVENNINNIELYFEEILAELREKEARILELEKILEREQEKTEVTPIFESNNEKYVFFPKENLNLYVAYPMITNLLDNNKLDIVNDILLAIKESVYFSLSENSMDKLLMILYRYMNLLPKKTVMNMAGVSKVLKNLNSKSVQGRLKELFSEIFSKSYYLHNVDKNVTVDYTKMYYMNNMYEEVRSIISNIETYKLYYGMSKNSLVDLSLINGHIGINRNIINSNQVIKNTISEVGEVELGFIRDSVSGGISATSKFVNFQQLKNHLKNSDLDIAQKVYENLVAKNKDVSELYLNSSKNKCDNDKTALINKRVNIPVYNKNSNIKSRSITASVLWCSKCNKFSLSQELLQQINDILGPNEAIKFVNAGLLNDESDLKVLGYSTSVPRNKRQRLLKEVIIPRLGAKKVVNHLRFLINLNEKKVNIDVSKALIEWKSDLEMVTSNYRIY